MQHRLIARKLCNFLIQDAEANLSLAGKIADVTGIDFQAEFVLNQFKKAYGGLWVGGTALLTENDLTFKPNMLNTMFHSGDTSLSVPLVDILKAEDQFGFFTRTIHLTTAKSTLKLRCYGAKAFVASINRAISEAKA